MRYNITGGGGTNTVRKGILYLLTFIVFLSVAVNAETNINGYETGLMSKIYGHFGIMTYRHGFFNKAHNVTEVEATFPVYRIATHSHPENPIGKPLDYAVEYSEYAVIAKVIKKERLEKDVDFQKNPVKYFCIELEIQDVIYGEITDKYIKAYGQTMFFQSNGECINYSRYIDGDTYIIFLEKVKDIVYSSEMSYEFAAHDRINITNPDDTFWHSDGRWDKNSISEYFDPREKDEIIDYIKNLYTLKQAASDGL